MLVLFFQKSHLANCLLWDTVLSMNIKGGSLETYSETCWESIYDTMNSIIHVKPAIDKSIATLADCFIGIVQIAIALKKIPISNDLCALAIAFSFNLMPATWWKVVEDKYNYLQELAKTIFAIIPFQASCKQIFFILKWFSEECHIWLQVPRLETNDITMALQDLVDLSDLVFGTNNNQKEITLFNREETNIAFEYMSLVQDAL
ncbi:2728_t:CDS:2, partial [Cetraspora pellucida]